MKLTAWPFWDNKGATEEGWRGQRFDSYTNMIKVPRQHRYTYAKCYLSTHSCSNIQFEHTLVLQYTILNTHSCCNVPFAHTLVLQSPVWAHTHATIYHLSTHSCCNIQFKHTVVLQYTIWILSDPHATKYPVGTHLYYKIALQVLP